MSESSRLNVAASGPTSEQQRESSRIEPGSERQIHQWGGRAGVAGGLLLVASAAVVGALGLPDASDIETLRDFADIEVGRIIEHFLYLGALVLFALQVLVLHRLLRTGHQAAALFGTAVAEIGLTIMAAGSLLHVSTSPLADLSTSSDTPPEDLASIEYAWHGAQSVFDTMLATGVLLVPIGIVLLGVAMRRTPVFGPRLTWFTIGLGIVGFIGGAIAVVVPGSAFSAAAVAAIVVFHMSTGWRTLQLADEDTLNSIDREDRASASISRTEP